MTSNLLNPTFNQGIGRNRLYELDTTKAQKIYTIPFSKKAVDDIIAKSVHTDKDKGIVFTIKFSQTDNPYGNTQMTTRDNNSHMNNSAYPGMKS